MLLVGLLLGFAGPYGTNPAYTRATRYLFWMSMTVVGAIIALATDRAISTTAIRSRPARIGVVTIVSAIPMTFVVAWTMSLIQTGRTFGPAQLAGLFVAVAVIQLVIVMATTLAAPPVDADTPSALPDDRSVQDTPSFPPALLDKLPPDFGDAIVALETEDHYLRVHGTRGNALILMRMSDAVALLDPRLGIQVHRRWWVAEAEVAGLRTVRAKPLLSMSNGLEIPVGRTFAATVRTRFARNRSA